jgi:adenosylcobyric acid synthase
MGMAEIADAPVLLVADIDKGGVFASIYGTVMLLPPEQRARFRGVIINKFRGDVSLLDDGLKKIEALTGVPVLGVVPMLDVDIDDEDAITVRHARAKAAHAADLVDIAVIALPRISNSTDFNALDRNPLVNLRYLRNPQDLGSPDLVILPGTKSTLADLDWLRRTGLAPAITALAQSGTPVIGICGGYQMLGRRLSDPLGVEGGGQAPGLGLLDTETTFTPDKTRTLVDGRVANTTGFFAPLSGAGFTGYEIHMGETTGRHERFAELRMVSDSACNGGNEASPDGQVSDHVLGSYVHGLFDGEFGDHLVRLLATNRGLNADFEDLDAVAYQESQFELLADALRNHLDLDAIRQIAGTNT